MSFKPILEVRDDYPTLGHSVYSGWRYGVGLISNLHYTILNCALALEAIGPAEPYITNGWFRHLPSVHLDALSHSVLGRLSPGTNLQPAARGMQVDQSYVKDRRVFGA